MRAHPSNAKAANHETSATLITPNTKLNHHAKGDTRAQAMYILMASHGLRPRQTRHNPRHFCEKYIFVEK